MPGLTAVGLHELGARYANASPAAPIASDAASPRAYDSGNHHDHCSPAVLLLQW